MPATAILERVSLDQLLTWASSAAGVYILIATYLGKAKESHLDRLESERSRISAERDRLAERVAALEASREADTKRVDALEEEVAFHRIERKELLNFLEDVSGGSFSLDWCQKRAGELKGRYSL